MVVFIFIGKKLLEIFNNILKRIPILRTIYSAFVQMLDIFNKSDENIKNVVLVEYPRKGSWAVGFATKENKSEISIRQNKIWLMYLCPQLQIQLVVFY